LILIGRVGTPRVRADVVLVYVNADHGRALAGQPIRDGPG
jgi:hypothetical protein